MTYYAGLDVSLRTVNICVIDGQSDESAPQLVGVDPLP